MNRRTRNIVLAVAGVLAVVVAVVVGAAVLGADKAETPVSVTSVAGTTAPTTPAAAPTPDLQECRTAIRGDYEAGWAAEADPWPPATRTATCSGIDRPTLKRLMDEAVADIMSGTTGPG